MKQVILMIVGLLVVSSNKIIDLQVNVVTDEIPPQPETEQVGACFLGDQTGCSTDVALGLTNQIIAELGVMGYSFKALDSTWVHCTTPCVNMLQTAAADSLVAAAKSKNDYITTNSAFRSSAQQYLLYNWYKKGICGITLAAVPGKSSHEGGRAIDTSSYNYWLTTLQGKGWTHSYPTSDPVHFDYLASPDLAANNLKAFQRLWNKKNTNKISEDGIFGPATENALANAPCGGWIF